MKNRPFYLTVTLLLAASIVFWGWMFQQPAETNTEANEAAGMSGNNTVEITMYRGEGCMCCIKWADYLEENGFQVADRMVDDLYEVKQEHGIPGSLSSCHTAFVDGYVIEGHVPAEDIRRLLAEQPDAIGLSVPGMPPNAPGMDAPVSREYRVILFEDAETMSVYAVHH